MVQILLTARKILHCKATCISTLKYELPSPTSYQCVSGGNT